MPLLEVKPSLPGVNSPEEVTILNSAPLRGLPVTLSYFSTISVPLGAL